jgi:hypothetical protein
MAKIISASIAFQPKISTPDELTSKMGKRQLDINAVLAYGYYVMFRI